MFKELMALLRLRVAIIVANKSLLIQLVIPIFLIAIYQFMFNRHGDHGLLVLLLSLGIVHSVNGQLISLVMAEEQEKHNLRSLQLVGVKSWQYLLANALIPIFITVAYLVILPLVLSVDLKGYWLTYLVVNAITALVLLALYILIGVSCDTQSKATVYGMPLMMGAMLLPMLSMNEAGLEKVARYTFMSAYVKWMKTFGEMKVTDSSILVSLLWLFVVLGLAVTVLRRSRLNR